MHSDWPIMVYWNSWISHEAQIRTNANCYWISSIRLPYHLEVVCISSDW